MLTCTLSDGRRLAWRTAGNGPPLILLHGWAMSSAVFAEIMPLLEDSFTLYCPDLPGHGASDPAASYSLTGLVSDLDCWCQHLGLNHCALLGWSLGGQLAIHWARSGLLSVAKLILVATTPRFVAAEDWPAGLPEVQVRAMARQLRRAYELTMSDFFARMFKGEELSRERYREIIRFAVRTGHLPVADDVLGCLELLQSTDLRAQLPAIDLPTLVHYGAVDEITLPAAGHFLADHLSYGEQVCWPAVGHAPFLSRPEQSAQLWKDFLSA
jgi:pimeloyl-[acyl-carrier protein] methyl ester esterase